MTQDLGALSGSREPRPTSGLGPSGFDPGRGFMLRPYTVEVSGFGAFAYPAPTRGKAMAEAWQDYQICSDCTFGDFLKLARCRLSDRAPRFGEPIMVADHLAFYVGERGQYVRFVRPGETLTFLAHPADVTAIADRNPEGRDGEARLGAKHESAGLKGIAQPPSEPIHDQQ